ncbi:hypothetical protein VSDG_07000 [Cytospora chrysosperma]|uniref:RRM domain-containing protein n=1 Tax=Cytospora chrysosperma TaxID=252740 RepID=A0A423VRW0_CYTCH|nr:hypothetical protein VSDG_07000 [Valsa sordida]
MSSDSETPTRDSPEVEAPTKTTSKKRKNDISELEVDLTLPEPPSKKAKRLLKKGKTLPAKKDSDDDGDDDEGEAKTAAAAAGDDATSSSKKKKERSPYGVWIGNLRFTVTKEDLRKWLIENSGGTITGAMMTRVHLPSSKLRGSKRPESAGGGDASASFENKGYAYVDFTTYEGTLAAIALSETEWHRRPLLIKDAKSYEGRPKKEEAEEAAAAADAKAKAAAPVSTSRKVFVGNLSFQTTEDDLHELFSPCGEIEWLKVAQFEDTGKCKGYGWVKFKEAESADWAVKGFVKIKEVEETEEDFMDVDEKEEEEGDGKAKDDEEGGGEEEEKEKADTDGSGSDSGSDSDSKPKKAKKPAKKPKKEERKVKTRKWWVNTLHGRRLKIEHAEDDQTRYKKRYGKDGAKNSRGGGKFQPGQQQQQRPQQQPPRQSNFKHNNDARRRKNEAADGEKDTASAPPKEPVKPAEISNFRQDINVARLTGAPVKSEGKKITFD